MNPIQDYLFNPDPSIGGGIIPMVGMPGSGKTVGLTQIAIKGLKNDNYVLWRGTKQAQWKHILANGYDIVLWNHDSIDSIEGYITSDKANQPPETIDIESKDIEIRQWSQPEEILDNMHPDKVNVINIPGLSTGSRNDLYFFRKQWINIFTALTERRSGRMIMFPFDEIGDVIPSQQQLRKPFYSLVAEQLPPKLAQLRKKRVMLYGAAHSTHDIHYFFWKIKANSILYMSNSVVKRNITPGIDQQKVTSLDRGQFLFPPRKEPASFGLPKMPSDLEWIPEGDANVFNIDWECTIPDVLNDGKSEDDSRDGRKGNLSKSKAAAHVYDKLQSEGFTQQECADMFNISKRSLQKARANA